MVCKIAHKELQEKIDLEHQGGRVGVQKMKGKNLKIIKAPYLQKLYEPSLNHNKAFGVLKLKRNMLRFHMISHMPVRFHTCRLLKRNMLRFHTTSNQRF